MSVSLSHRIRRIFKSMKVNVCGCHRNEDVLVTIDTDTKPYSRPSSDSEEEDEPVRYYVSIYYNV